MALTQKSLFLYNYEITPFNSSIDFKASSGGPVLQATLNLGFYSLSALLREIERAMTAIDSSQTYTATADRTVMGGLQNRVTISATSFLSLLFLTGPRAASSVASLIGFSALDFTGFLSYTGTQTSGIVLIPSLVGYSYLSPDFNQKQFGTVNVSASGVKEAIVFQTQKFVEVRFKYEPASRIINEWNPLFSWMSKQRLFEFTPQYTDPNTFYEVTLEKSTADGKGLAFRFPEMLPDFPNFYDIGALTFRINEV